MKKLCTVLLTNKAYFHKMLHTLHGILSFECNSDIVVIVGNDLVDSDELNHPLLKNDKVIIKHFADIKFSENFDKKFYSINRSTMPQAWTDKKFQYHKFHTFNEYFKNWNFVLYIDSGASVLNSVDIMFKAKKNNIFCAHCDGYMASPFPYNPWFLKRQFDETDSLFLELSTTYNLENYYPQSTLMLFDTTLIEEQTFNELVELAERWPISITNDQGIIALYFSSIKDKWEQIQLGDNEYWYYDFSIRPSKVDKPHVIVKYI